MYISKALQSNLHITHNATCFFSKTKNFAKPFFKFVLAFDIENNLSRKRGWNAVDIKVFNRHQSHDPIRRVRENFLTKINVLAIKVQILY